MLTLVVTVIVIALLFDFLNGMNDAANSIATIVSTGVLSPKFAVAWAAFFNFAAAFGLGVKVAKTIGKGIVDVSVVDSWLILAALLAAVVWVWICTAIGLPISVSHSLIGGLAGAGIAKAGWGALIVPGLVKVAVFIVVAPVLGLTIGFVLMVIVHWLFRNAEPRRVDGVFRIGQLVSSAAYSLGHGLNDAQKTMGIIAVLLFSAGYMKGEFHIPVWVVFASYTVIALGTLTGGWKVIRTMGARLTRLQPVGGFCAETAGAISIFIASSLGIPVSTTHTIAGAIAGVGSVKRVTAVRWGVAREIVGAWVLTLPTSALVAMLAWWLIAWVRG